MEQPIPYVLLSASNIKRAYWSYPKAGVPTNARYIRLENGQAITPDIDRLATAWYGFACRYSLEGYRVTHATGEAYRIVKDDGSDYLTSADGCTCQNWTKQANAFRGTGLPPLCKHQVIRAVHLYLQENPAPERKGEGFSIVWDVFDCELRYALLQGKTVLAERAAPLESLPRAIAKWTLEGYHVATRSRSLLSKFHSKR